MFSLEKINTRNRKRHARSPWITPGLLRSINRKHNLYLKYKTNPTECARLKYLNYKNTLTGLLRREKKMYFERRFWTVRKMLKALGI